MTTESNRRRRAAAYRKGFADGQATQITPGLKEIILLHIIACCGGECASSESKWSWLNWFCDDEADPGATDTFNRCNEKGWLHTTHDSDTDVSTTTLTSTGRSALSSPVEGGTEKEAHPLASFPNGLNPGLYTIFWKSGGSSQAAIGMMENGQRWIAPTNWIRPGTYPNAGEWAEIDRAELISPSASAEIEALRVENETLKQERDQLQSSHDCTSRYVLENMPKDQNPEQAKIGLAHIGFMEILKNRAEAAEAEIAFLAKEARRYASHYPEVSDGRNTFILFAEMIECRAALQQQEEGK